MGFGKEASDEFTRKYFKHVFESTEHLYKDVE